jgi:hypothetical protein
MLNHRPAHESEDQESRAVSGDAVKAIPQEQMSESVHGTETPQGDARTAAADEASDDENSQCSKRIPQEMMAETAADKSEIKNA